MTKKKPAAPSQGETALVDDYGDANHRPRAGASEEATPPSPSRDHHDHGPPVVLASFLVVEEFLSPPRLHDTNGMRFDGKHKDTARRNLLQLMM
jgi:hypothetical protein